ncbi:polysaccharide deacetylase [Haloferula helveola]|uniref:Polysaccharide deacetylase n=1 Tax=Haloferula helveola TaxID=490095 RepID=A0ABM7RIH1_9BACT|nr:polysaccharide deacetylase [Haloferula helveola]
MRSLRRYHAFLIVLLVGTVVLGYGLNTVVNPWRVTPTSWSSQKLEPYREIDNTWNRTAKAGLVRSGTWDAAMFGSSRVDIALDPKHPLFDGMRCANLGLNAAQLFENKAIFDYFMDREDAKLVVFAIDAGDLTTPPPKRNPTDFALSPLDRDADPIERELRYHLGISTCASSFETLGRAVGNEPADHTPEGFRHDSEFPKDLRQTIAGLYLATTVRMVEGRKRYGKLDPTKLEVIRSIVERCRQDGTRLVFLITPNHALFQTCYRELGDPDPWFEKDRAALAQFASPGVEIWDFLDGHALNAEPLPPADQPGAHFDHWIDLFHATPEVGNLILDRIAGKAGNYGRRLEPDSVEARVREVQQGVDRYLEANPDDLNFLRKSLKRYQP